MAEDWGPPLVEDDPMDAMLLQANQRLVMLNLVPDWYLHIYVNSVLEVSAVSMLNCGVL